MYKKGSKGKLWRLMKECYVNCKSCVLVNGYSEWFDVNVGVKQGGIFSMYLYVCFINDLLLQLSSGNLGCCINDIKSSCIAYADDLCVCTLHAPCMQQTIDCAWQYSRKWRFTFNVKKCATLLYCVSNNRINDRFFLLGNDVIELSTDYVHLGIKNPTKHVFCFKEVMDRINKMKFTLYNTVGCSFNKCTLSPKALSKLYWSVGIPKLLFGCEIKFFDKKELHELEKAHRGIAKQIQGLPQNTQDPVCLSTLGWMKVQTYIDKSKLLFMYRILCLPPCSIFRCIYVLCFFQILYSDLYVDVSPVAQVIDVCKRYGILDQIVSIILSGAMPTKRLWKRMVENKVWDLEFKRWRQELKLYRNLLLFRTVILRIEMCVWWDMAKHFTYLKRACINIMKLLTGNNCLRVHKDVSITRDLRICKLCMLREIEDEYHFIMNCPVFSSEREDLKYDICSKLSVESFFL